MTQVSEWQQASTTFAFRHCNRLVLDFRVYGYMTLGLVISAHEQVLSHSFSSRSVLASMSLDVIEGYLHAKGQEK